MILTMDLLFINVVWIFVFFFNDTATTEIYTLSHTTLFRSPGPTSLPVAPVRRQRPDLRWHGARRPCHAGSRRGHGGRSAGSHARRAGTAQRPPSSSTGTAARSRGRRGRRDGAGSWRRAWDRCGIVVHGVCPQPRLPQAGESRAVRRPVAVGHMTNLSSWQTMPFPDNALHESPGHRRRNQAGRLPPQDRKSVV